MKKEKKEYHSLRKPSLLGGKKGFEQFLQENLKYPQEAVENKKEGVAHVKCEISDKGKVIKAESINHLGFGLDQEAERLCLLMRFDNTEERGMKIKHTKTLRIGFTLPKPKQEALPVNYNYQTITTATKPEEKKSSSYSYTIKF